MLAHLPSRSVFSGARSAWIRALSWPPSGCSSPGVARAQVWNWKSEDVDHQSAGATSIAVDADGNVHVTYGTDAAEWKYAFRRRAPRDGTPPCSRRAR